MKTIKWCLATTALSLCCAIVSPAAPTSAPSEPLRPTGVLRLDEAGPYELGFAYRKSDPQILEQGWTGTFEPKTGVACKAMGMQNEKSAWLLHVPWRGGVGTTYQQWKVTVPEKGQLMLRGAVALLAEMAPKSDGVTFRVLAGADTPELLWEQNSAAAAWHPFEIDLTRFAGQTVKLRFEVNPGPKWNAAYDYSLWGERELLWKAAP